MKFTWTILSIFSYFKISKLNYINFHQLKTGKIKLRHKNINFKEKKIFYLVKKIK